MALNDSNMHYTHSMDHQQSELVESEDQTEVDIHINNVVCNFTLRCHLNLRQIATHGANVVYNREQSVN